MLVDINSRMRAALDSSEPQIQVARNRILGGEYSAHVFDVRQTSTFSPDINYGVIVNNNLVDGVTAGDYIAHLRFSSDWVVEVRDNIVRNASAASGALYYAVQPDGTGRPSIHFNTFENVRAPLLFRVEASDRQTPFNVSYNYWGTERYSDIAAAVYDELDDPALETVDFVPYLDAAGDVVPFDPSDALRQPDGSLAGKLLSNLTFATGRNYTISGTLIVPSELVLTIEAGAVLRLGRGVTIKVEGALQAVGDAGNPIIVMPLAWNMTDEEARARAAAGTLGVEFARNATYLGCYQDRSSSELQGLETYSSDMTIGKCIALCHDAGFAYAGLEAGRNCRCDDRFGMYGKIDESRCRAACDGDRDTICGGYDENSMYSTGSPGGSWGDITFAAQALPTAWSEAGEMMSGSFLRHVYLAGGGLPLGSRGSTIVVSSDNVAFEDVSVSGAASSCIAFDRAAAASTPLRLQNLRLEQCVGNGLFFRGGMFAAGALIQNVQMGNVGFRAIYVDFDRENSVSEEIRISNIYVENGGSHAALFRAAVPAFYFADLFVSSPIMVTNVSIQGHATSHAVEAYRVPCRIENALFDNIGSARDHYCVYYNNLEQSYPQGGMINGTCRNSRSGLYVRQDYNDDSGFALTDSTFEDLDGEYALYYYPSRIEGGVDMALELDFQRNRIVRGTFTNNIVHVVIPCCGDTEYYLRDNSITNATSTGGHVVQIDKVGSSSIDVRFERNALVGNVAEDALHLSGGSGSSERRPAVHLNTLANPGLSGYELRVAVADANAPVNATLNFWDTDVEYSILQKVFDIGDDTDVERVLTFPFLLSSNPSDVVDLDAERAAFVGPNGEVRGVVESDAVLSLADAPLPNGTWPIVGNLIVASGATLEVEPGVTLVLEPGVGINVKGTLLTEGRPGATVTLTCNASTAVPRGQYHGCRGDLNENFFPSFTDYTSMTVDACLEFCSHHGHTFAALEFETCMCLNGDEGSVAANSACRRGCEGV